MRLLCLLLVLSFPLSALAEERKGNGWGAIQLNGEQVDVKWSDGDSFKFKSGENSGQGVRLTGYNTLESYGPVHRWGGWTAGELYGFAKLGKSLASARVWDCTSEGERDGYGRLLVSCPDVAVFMILNGHAHVFGLEDPVSKAALKAQKRAQDEGIGMWAKGVPSHLITSLHSADENPDKGYTPYNRWVDTATGESAQAEHGDTYAVCQEVCMGPEATQSCMIYVPFTQRYRNKPDCLEPWRKKKEQKKADEAPPTPKGEPTGG